MTIEGLDFASRTYQRTRRRLRWERRAYLLGCILFAAYLLLGVLG